MKDIKRMQNVNGLNQFRVGTRHATTIHMKQLRISPFGDFAILAAGIIMMPVNQPVVTLPDTAALPS